MHIYFQALVVAEKLPALALWPAVLIAKRAQLPILVAHVNRVLT